MLQLVLDKLKVGVEFVLLVPRRIMQIAVAWHALFPILLLRAVDRRVQRSFHGWCFCGDIIANSIFS